MPAIGPCLMRFDRVNPEAVRWAAQRSNELVVEINDETKRALRQLLVNSFEQGIDPASLARMIRDNIGLNSLQMSFVANLESELRAAKPGDLITRFGPGKGELRGVSGFRLRVPPEGLSEQAIQRALNRYRDMQLNLRARTIARTETIRASNVGQQQLWLQAQMSGELPADMERVWLAKHDGRTRDSHLAMHGQRSMIGIPFKKPDGSLIEPGEEPNCRCSQGLVESLEGKTDQEILDSHSYQFEPVNMDAYETRDRFRFRDGNYSPDRSRLHQAIIRKHFEGLTPVEDPQVIFMGGGTASGKSILEKTELKGKIANHVLDDTDEVRQMLAEWAEGVGMGLKDIGTITHEEASDLAHKIADLAVQRKYNVLIQGTGSADGDFNVLRDRIAALRSNGHKVIAHYVSADLEIALERNARRFEKTGRMVPQSVMEASHRNVSIVLPRAMREGIFDEAYLWDTNISGTSRLVATSVPDHGGFIIHDSELWGRFLDKVSWPPVPDLHGHEIRQMTAAVTSGFGDIFAHSVRGQIKADIVDSIKTELIKSWPELFGPERFKPESYWLEEGIQDLIDGWAHTAGDSYPRAVALQMAAQREFGLTSYTLEHFQQIVKSAADLILQQEFANGITNETFMRKFLRAQYNITQQFLEDQGLEYVTLVRGANYSKENALFGTKIGSGITIQGITGLPLQPLSSFTSAWETAASFGGTVHIIRVPRSAILATSRTGIGCFPELEVVVLSNDYSAWTLTVQAETNADLYGFYRLLKNYFGGQSHPRP